MRLRSKQLVQEISRKKNLNLHTFRQLACEKKETSTQVYHPLCPIKYFIHSSAAVRENLAARKRLSF